MHSKDLEDLNTRLAHVQRLHQGDPERMKKAQMDSKCRSFALSLFLSFSLSLSLSLSLFLSLSFLLFLSFSLSYSISFSLLHTHPLLLCVFSLRVCLLFVFGCASFFSLLACVSAICFWLRTPFLRTHTDTYKLGMPGTHTELTLTLILN